MMYPEILPLSSKYGFRRAALGLALAGILSFPLAAAEYETKESSPWLAIAEVPAVDTDSELLELTRSLSVEQAVVLALRHNRELRMQQLEPIRAGAFVEMEKARFDSTLYLEGGYAREEGEALMPGTPEDTEGYSLEAGIERQFTTGTRVVGSLQQEFGSAGDFEQDQFRLGLSVTQALLQGRDRGANLARLEQAQLDSSISRYELQGYAEALVARVESTYWDYSLAQQQVSIYEQSLEIARQQHRETRDRVDVGSLAPTELAATRAEVARHEQDLIDARSMRDKLQISLLQMLGISPTELASGTLGVDQSPGVPTIVLDDITTHVELGWQQRPEIRQTQLQWEKGELEVTRTRSGLLPRLDLFANLGKSGYSDSFGSGVSEIGDSAYDFNVGLRFELPLGNRGANAAHRVARVSQHQADLSLENLRRLVEADIYRAYLEVQRSREQIDASRVTRERQEEVLRAEEERFAAGTSTSIQVARAQRDLITARLGEVQAVVAYYQSLTDLYRLEGTLLQRRGIEITTS
ncbi:TolC family protein [Desulfurispira natronophila]|uniref:Outer membrane protein TolC n=1 Tax=Desulfurispira natronophila TaxID=682562 RepID=A0A7W7Y3S6_9BACT|nr:TolC family protein [Desulfurispira natronophila]MBB5021561.1 outer membrane protein TolC [Desulfurispira natronophila]